MTFLVGWFPDWPMQAAAREGLIPEQPCAMLAGHRIMVCNVPAREYGIRRGMQQRQAQGLCPHIHFLQWDQERDARIFRDVLEGLYEEVADIEILRPGLLLLNLDAVAAWKGVDAAIEGIATALSQVGVECCFGVGAIVSSAIMAARLQQDITVENLAQVPLRILRDEPALGCDPTVVQECEALGLTTLGELAGIGSRDLEQRFGGAGRQCYAIATGEHQHFFDPAVRPEIFSIREVCEEPIIRVDEAAFLAKRMAAQLHCLLQKQELVCQRLRIQAVFDVGIVERIWTTQQPLGESDMSDRIRWQLSGQSGKLLELEVQAECARAMEQQLWGQTSNTIASSIARVQARLGANAVQQPIHIGGRGPECVALVPYGTQEGKQQSVVVWKAALPSPLPARVFHPAARSNLRDGEGQEIQVDGDHLSASPASFYWGARDYLVDAWAGPWLVDDAWWQDGKLCARVQIQCGQEAFLLVWTGHWRVEASYT